MLQKCWKSEAKYFNALNMLMQAGVYLRICVCYTSLYLERSSHPKGVACVYRFVGAPMEAGLLPHDTPASDPVQLPLTQRLLQSTHQTQRGYGAVRPATWTHRQAGAWHIHMVVWAICNTNPFNQMRVLISDNALKLKSLGMFSWLTTRWLQGTAVKTEGLSACGPFHCQIFD